MTSPYDLRLSFSADDALDLQRDSNMTTRIRYVPSPTELSHGDDAVRIANSPPRLLPHEILRLRPLAVAVGFDQLEDSDGRTVVIMPSQNDKNSQRDCFTGSSTSRSVATFGSSSHRTGGELQIHRKRWRKYLILSWLVTVPPTRSTDSLCDTKIGMYIRHHVRHDSLLRLEAVL